MSSQPVNGEQQPSSAFLSVRLIVSPTDAGTRLTSRSRSIYPRFPSFMIPSPASSPIRLDRGRSSWLIRATPPSPSHFYRICGVRINTCRRTCTRPILWPTMVWAEWSGRFPSSGPRPTRSRVPSPTPSTHPSEWRRRARTTSFGPGTTSTRTPMVMDSFALAEPCSRPVSLSPRILSDGSVNFGAPGRRKANRPYTTRLISRCVWFLFISFSSGCESSDEEGGRFYFFDGWGGGGFDRSGPVIFFLMGGNSSLGKFFILHHRLTDPCPFREGEDCDNENKVARGSGRAAFEGVGWLWPVWKWQEKSLHIHENHTSR